LLTELETDVKDLLAKASVTGLFYYPIKSCRGWALNEAYMTSRGIRHDREFMIVEAETGSALTQRELATMALIEPHITAQGLRIDAPKMPTLEFGITTQGAGATVTLWGDNLGAVDQGDDAAKWLSEYLKTEVRLVRMADDFRREIDQDYSLSDYDQTGFADGFPTLIVSEEGLADLNARMDEPLPMNRFRPNIVIAGSGVPFAEDHLYKFQLGDVTMYAVKPCGRCAITTTDQETAERGKEPLKTLATFRKAANGKVMFGQNVLHENSGVIRVGDHVSVLETRTPDWKA
jgi:uncharacterized protein